MFFFCSGFSWSGSSNTQEQSLPVTPELSYSPVTTLASPDEMHTTVFLSKFRDSDADPFSDISRAHRLVRLEGGDARQLYPFGDRDGNMKRNKRLPDLPVGCMADNASPDEENLKESPTPMPSTMSGRAPSGHGFSHTSAGVWKSRRFCRDSGDPSRSTDFDPIHDESPIDLAKDPPVTHSPSPLTFPLKHDMLPPPSCSEVSKLFSEEETATVREFLRLWGSNNRVKASRSKVKLDEDEAPGGCDGDYSWEAVETEDSVWDRTPCSILLDEVSKMVGLPLEQSSIASTAPGLSTPDLLTQNDQLEVSQSPDFPSSYQSAALVRSPRILSDGDDADVGDRAPSAVYQHVDQPLDVAPRVSATRSLLAGSNTYLRGTYNQSVAPKSMDVPVVLATSSNVTSPADSSHDLFLQRRLSPSNGRTRSIDSDLRRRGQIFNVETTRPASSGGPTAADVDMSFVPTREPPLPPPLTALSATRVTALDRLESSLSRLKAHGSHQRKPSSTEKVSIRVHASSGDRRSPQCTTPRERKHHSGVTARGPYPRSAHGRHFSSPVADGVPGRPKPPQTETDPINAHLRERAAKLFPYPENRELTMRSFMEMDVAPPKTPPPRRTSRIGRVAARLSQGIMNFGKNLTGSRGIKEYA
jgi:hypothetical protein